jgi:tetratricopeptide (TPR) repeat protein
MDPSLQSLLARLDDLCRPFPKLRDGIQKAGLIAELDPEMALTRTRKVLGLAVCEVYQRRYNEPAGTRPLENLLQRLLKDGYLPALRATYANGVRELGNVGTHRSGEDVTAADVHQSLSQLLRVLDWYVGEARAAAPPPAVPPDGQRTADRPTVGAVVVPKGLRSFDAGDARFFLNLLPGARDEDGLPESIGFWKRRIQTDKELPFTVGVLYGPSGCGKSSLVKAGLLPRLAGHVLIVYVEAAPEGTEARLLGGLRKRCPGLPADADLAGTLATLRQGQGLQAGRKVFIVLDQFEQWLHANRGVENPELAQALRQCDGEHVQCLVLVRDDFWVPLSRFMRDLHIELLQGQNNALVELFDLLHARDVLSAFGRAFRRLNDPPSPEQEAFLKKAVQGLSEDGRVIPVRLALFAEMVKGRPWTPDTLKEIGGTGGVGVAFLEETFAARMADPRHRLHEQAARAVLKALLPEQGTDIKGSMQPHDKLLQESGYAGRPRDFEELLRLLDSELRLLTPTEPPGVEAPGARYYQLTHDYLVPALRQWLTRKQRETWRGRAELRLAEGAALWQAKPDNRHLPPWWEWLDIRLLTRKRDWTPPQRRMMGQAGRYHGLRGLALACTVLVLVAASFLVWGAYKAEKRQHAIDKALTAALSGDLDAAEQATAEAEAARASPGQVHMLRGQIALHRGQSREARRHLEKAVELLPDSVAAWGMLAAACADDGDWEQYDKAIQKMDDLTPSTPEDLLFKGYAQANLEPDTGLQTIEQARARRPMKSIAVLLRAEVRALDAQDRDDLGEAKGAVEDAKYAREFLGDNPAALWVSLGTHLAKAGVHEHRAELEQRSAELELARQDAEALKPYTALPEAVVYRWLYFREVRGQEKEEVLDELRQASEKTDHVYVTFCYALTLYRRGKPGDFEEALRVLGQSHRTYNDRLRPFVLAEHDYRAKLDWPASAQQALKDFAAHCQDGAAIMDSLAVLCLLDKKEDAVKASEALLEQPNRFYTLRREPILWCLKYNAGKLSEDELLKRVEPSRWNQCLAHYYVAMTKLAKGDREGAREHFDKVIETRAFLWGAYDMSWVFQARLKDPNWPPWIP